MMKLLAIAVLAIALWLLLITINQHDQAELLNWLAIGLAVAILVGISLLGGEGPFAILRDVF